MITTVVADRVMLGADWHVAWVLTIESLSQEEKALVLWKNLAGLLAI